MILQITARRVMVLVSPQELPKLTSWAQAAINKIESYHSLLT
jgi:hypothetical protein